MKIYLCGECYLQGYCRRLTSRVVMPGELTPTFIASVRRFMAEMDVSRDEWPHYLDAAYRDYPGRILHPNGSELRLNTTLLVGRSSRYWYRDLCEPIPDAVNPRVRIEARGRFIVAASILRAAYPVPAIVWGRQPANDTDSGIRPCPPSAQDECRYRQFVIAHPPEPPQI